MVEASGTRLWEIFVSLRHGPTGVERIWNMPRKALGRSFRMNLHLTPGSELWSSPRRVDHHCRRHLIAHKSSYLNNYGGQSEKTLQISKLHSVFMVSEWSPIPCRTRHKNIKTKIKLAHFKSSIEMKKMVEAYWVKTLVRGCFFMYFEVFFCLRTPWSYVLRV